MHVGRGPLAVSNSRCESASARVVGCDQWTSESLNGGSWLVINRVISRVTILITHIGGHNPTYNYPNPYTRKP